MLALLILRTFQPRLVAFYPPDTARQGLRPLTGFFAAMNASYDYQTVIKNFVTTSRPDSPLEEVRRLVDHLVVASKNGRELEVLIWESIGTHHLKYDAFCRESGPERLSFQTMGTTPQLALTEMLVALENRLK